VLSLAFEPDADLSDNSCETSLTVGEPAGHVAINEIMYSPDDDGTEWLELINASAETVSLVNWGVGDETETNLMVSSLWAGTALVLPPDGFIVVAKDTGSFDYVTDAPVVETDGWEALSSDDVVSLVDRFRTPVDVVRYERSWGGGRGVSLERVRPDMPSDDRNNWGGCVAVGGATPGADNSIFLAELPSGGTVRVSPNPFTPNSDGVSDRTIISFEIPLNRATARLSVFDLKGRRRALLLDHVGVAGRGEFIWDGTGADGAALPTGLYVLLLEAIDAPRGEMISAKTCVAIVR
jgi:hypothetical protein